MFGEHITMGQALFVTLLSMGTVFTILAVIAFLLGFFEHLFSGTKKEAPAKPGPVKPAMDERPKETIEATDDPAIIAVITAAILASQTSTYPIRISRIRRVGAAQSNWQNQGNE